MALTVEPDVRRIARTVDPEDRRIARTVEPDERRAMNHRGRHGDATRLDERLSDGCDGDGPGCDGDGDGWCSGSGGSRKREPRCDGDGGGSGWYASSSSAP